MIVEAAGIYPDHLSYFNEAACAIPGKLGQIGTAGKAVGTDILDYIKNVGSKLTNMKKLAAITEAIELEVK